MGAKIGDKFIIEIDRVYSANHGISTLYGIKGFHSLVFDEEGVRRLTSYVPPMVSFPKESDFFAALNEKYEQGIKDGADLAAMHGSDATSKQLEDSFWQGAKVGAKRAWEVARNIVAPDGMPMADIQQLFGCGTATDVIVETEAEDAIAKFSYYETEMQDKEIKVGDIVFDGESAGIVTKVQAVENRKYYHAVDKSGHAYYLADGKLKRCGENIDLNTMFEKIKDAEQNCKTEVEK